ncbi:MAG TPA: hypothetical protein VFN17_06880 [Nitrosarchaeum sp.]|nr:hypothetical protein [Nitrosarchaeum sp.]
MSDMRYIIIGIVIIFSGFLILGVFGNNYQIASIEASEFDKCYQYYENKEPVEINCSSKIFEQTLFFVVVLVLIVGGIISLIKGVKGKWDNDVKPEDMVGPGGDKNLKD